MASIKKKKKQCRHPLAATVSLNLMGRVAAGVWMGVGGNGCMSRSGSAYWDTARIPAWLTSLAKKVSEARDSPKRWISFRSNLLHECDGIVSFPNSQKTATQKSETGSFSKLMRTLSKMCFPHLPSSAVLGLGALMISPVYPEHLVALVIV